MRVKISWLKREECATAVGPGARTNHWPILTKLWCFGIPIARMPLRGLVAVIATFANDIPDSVTCYQRYEGES